MSIVNFVLKAIIAAAIAGIGVLVGATVESDMTWADISLNTWLTAAGAALAAFTAVYFVPNSPSSDGS